MTLRAIQLLICLILFNLGNSVAQKFNKHSIELSTGNHSIVTQSKSVARFAPFTHYKGIYRYSFTNVVGIGVGMGYDRFVWKNSKEPTNHFQILITPTFNLNEILGISDISDNIGLLFNFGGGVASIRNKGSLVNREIAGVSVNIAPDRTWFISSGLSLHYLIRRDLAVFVSGNYNINFKQNLYLDLSSKLPVNDKVGSGFLNTTLGFRYYLGKNSKHADWFPNPKLSKEDIYRLLSLESQIELLQIKLEDYDEDGVINAMDDEPNTPLGAKVNSRGVSINLQTEKDNLSNSGGLPNSYGLDTSGLDRLIKEKLERQVSRSSKDSDGDGFPDDIDLCPDLFGKSKGCPDRDGDDIPDILDKCPDEKGLSIYSGCREPYQDPKLGERITTETVTTERIVKENYITTRSKNEVNLDTLDFEKMGISEVYFKSGSTEMSIEDMDKLNKIAALMKDNPKMKIKVIGYADNVGNPANNVIIAKKRASESVKFLVQQGIESERLSQSHKVVAPNPNKKENLRKTVFEVIK